MTVFRGHIAPQHEYDRELGAITDQDREYAADLLEDLEDGDDRLETATLWLRKVRYEAVIADRKRREA